MNAHTVDEQGNKHPVNWHDFLTNDNNPTLMRLTNKLLQDPEFQRILKDKGYEDINERTVD